MAWDLRKNTIAQYKMNDSGSSTVVNEFGTNGTYQDGNVVSIKGRINTALSIDGESSSWINTNQSFASVYNASFSINIWIKPNDGQPPVVWWFFGASNIADDNIYLRFTSTNLEFRYATAAAGSFIISEPHGFSNGQEDWHMITVSVEEVSPTTARAKLYMDGSIIHDSGIDAVTMSGWNLANFSAIGNYYFASNVD